MSTRFHLDNGETNFTTGQIELVVNGTSKGKVTVNSATDTVGKFAAYYAKAYGLKTFDVYIDGQQMDTANSGDELSGTSKFEIVAKDSRG